MTSYPTRLDMLRDLPPGAIGCEVGTQRGLFAKQILRLPVAKLHLVDCWEFQPGAYEDDPANIDDGGQAANERLVRDVFSNEVTAGRVVIHKGFSPAITQEFLARSLDFVYIDSSHVLEDVRADLGAWSRIAKSGGRLFLHDYVDNETSRGMGFGVMEAVTQFIKETPWSVIRVTEEEWPTVELAISS